MTLSLDTNRIAASVAATLLLCLGVQAYAQSIPASDDTWVREDNPDSNRNGNDQMNARADLDSDDNDVILLRFPTTDLTSDVAGAAINLYWQRSDGGTGNTLSVYGLLESDPDEATWTEGAVTYNNAPGLVPDGVDPVDEVTNGNTFDDIRDLDLANLSLLVDNQPYGPQVMDEIYSFSSPALDDFINADTNGQVSFLILRGNESTSGNQARFWPKEQFNGDFAPTLTYVPEPTAALLALVAAAAAMRRTRC